jgi:hypothetical protein
MRKTNLIKFETIDSLDGVIPNPKPAKKAIPNWYKAMEREIGNIQMYPDGEGGGRPEQMQTIKACPPIQDYLCTGYILPTITDLWMSYLGKGKDLPAEYFGIPSVDFNYIALHGPQQTKGSSLEGQDIYKLVSPWLIKTPPGFSCLFLKPQYLDTKRINILPAVVDTDIFHIVNFPFTFSSTEKDEVIPVGTPVVHVIPFKREAWSMEVTDIKKNDYIKVRNQSTIMFKNFYKKLRASNKRDFT